MYSLLTNVTTQFIDHLGVPIVGGKVYTYESGTTNPKITYVGSDPTSAQNLNPIVLDDAGRANIYLGDGAYRIIVKDKNDALIADVNAISRGVNVTEFENFIQQVNDGLNELALVKQNIDTYVDQAIEAKKNVAGGVPGLDANAQISMGQLSFGAANESEAGIVQLVNDLTTGGTNKALTAEQGKLLFAMFANSLGTNGYIKIPNPTTPAKPIIIQWMNVTITSTTQTANFPISFPTQVFTAVATSNSSSNNNVTTAGSFTNSAVTFLSNATSQTARCIAIGY